jgi:hypothetical protein
VAIDAPLDWIDSRNSTDLVSSTIKVNSALHTTNSQLNDLIALNNQRREEFFLGTTNTNTANSTLSHST